MEVLSYIYTANNDLIIEFMDHTRKKYLNVPRKIYNELINSNNTILYVKENLEGKYLVENLEKNYQLILS